jgi:hypothetical protein
LYVSVYPWEASRERALVGVPLHGLQVSMKTDTVILLFEATEKFRHEIVFRFPGICSKTPECCTRAASAAKARAISGTVAVLAAFELLS